MKRVTFLMTRHAKNVKGMLEQSEICRARHLGGNRLYFYDLNYVVSSTLPRAIHTAFSITIGSTSSPELLPVMPEFGTDEMFAEMTAPSQFRNIASVKGNYQALYDVHPLEKVRGWQAAMVAAFDRLFGEVEDDSVVLHVSHSPSIEMVVDGMFSRQGDTPPEFAKTMAELETLVLIAKQESKDAPIVVTIEEKIPAPAINAAAQ